MRDFDLWFVWAGCGTMRLKDGRTVTLRPGVCFWMRPTGRYIARQDSEQRLGVSFIHFDLKHPDAERPLSTGQLNVPELHQVPDFPLFDGVTRGIVRYLRAGRPAPAAGLLHALLVDLLTPRPEPAARQRGSVPEGLRRPLETAMRDIEERPWEPFRVADRARAIGYSPDHYSRMFRRLTGQTPQAFQIAKRIERARALLRETVLPIKEIAGMLGYADVFYFSRQFKAETGQSPAAFRKQGV
ncbi:MAG: helix-turn-helix domain-containing protein [Opitutales bacterium]